MNLKYWLVLSFTSVAFLSGLSGCAKNPPPPPPAVEAPPPPPPVVETPPPPPPPPPPVDTAALHRQRVQARVAETFKTLYFDYDKSELSADSKATCDAIGELMKEEPGITVRIEGNTDERGTNEYNQALGDRRAKAAQAYLISYGISSSRLSTISYGEEKPAVDGHDESAWSKNRRDDFTPTF
jgi:peptidoglycan-associated lipoprotein